MSKVKQAAEANKLKTASKQNKTSTKKPLRFIIVGISNTVLDFVLMNIMRLVGLNLIAANTISTGTAMVYSFFMNKKWTFRNAGKNYLRQVVLFFIFTIIGIWVIQNGFIWLINTYIPHFGLSDRFRSESNLELSNLQFHCLSWAKIWDQARSKIRAR